MPHPMVAKTPACSSGGSSLASPSPRGRNDSRPKSTAAAPLISRLAARTVAVVAAGDRPAAPTRAATLARKGITS